MQHRRNKKPLLLLIPVVLLVGGFIFLLSKDVPAPQQRIEKPLDASKFIKPKP